MPCYRPLKGFKAVGGGITWSPRQGYVDQPMEVPCGQCIGCRLERSRQWAVRIMHEASMHEDNVFVTLTYDDEHLPYRGCLQKQDFQKFMKRLRKKFRGRISFYHCGEYGDENWRPHYHAILFGVDFADRVFYSENGRGEKLYTSETLSGLWGRGLAVFGDVTFESAAYCARYCVKKVTGDAAVLHYQRVDAVSGERYQLPPEYATMSLKTSDGVGGIGFRWLQKFGKEVEDDDSVVMRGREMLPPRYYDKKRDKIAMKQVRKLRIRGAYSQPGELSEARRVVKEKVKLAQVQFLRRKV